MEKNMDRPRPKELKDFLCGTGKRLLEEVVMATPPLRQVGRGDFGFYQQTHPEEYLDANQQFKVHLESCETCKAGQEQFEQASK